MNFFHGLEREDLEYLLIVCTQKSHFQFNGNFYDQKDGVAMGSPLGPLFANIFMNNFELLHSEKLKELGVNIWLRYVDDVFATLSDKRKAEEILSYLNQQHPNIKFTIEHEVEDKLPFLDTSVYRSQTRYHTTLYRKKTFTGVYLNWTSLTAKKYKINLIYCLLDRIWKICSEIEERENEIKKLKIILAQNEYPQHIIDREIEKFINNRNKPQPNINITEDAPQTTTTSTDIKKRFIVLPYTGDKSEDFAKRLESLVTKSYPQIEFNVAFKTPNEIGKLFPFKDNIKNAKDKSFVVYRLKCEDCNASYIGKTKRIL